MSIQSAIPTPEEQERMRHEAFNASIQASFKSAYLPVDLRTKNVQFSQFGQAGKEISEAFTKPEPDSLLTAVKAGIGVHLIGEGYDLYQLHGLIARTLILKGHNVKVVPLSYISDLALDRKGELEDYMALQQARVWVIRGFQGDQDAMTPAELYRTGLFLAEYIDQGCTFITYAKTAIKDCKWWYPELKALMTKRSITFKVESK